VARCERLLESSRVQEATTRRQGLLDERARLEREVAALADDRDLLRAEAEAWLAVAAARARLVEARTAENQRAVRLISVRQQLGELEAEAASRAVITAVMPISFGARVAGVIRELAPMEAGVLRDAVLDLANVSEDSDRYSRRFVAAPAPPATADDSVYRFRSTESHKVA
jgi:hypothetical protein